MAASARASKSRDIFISHASEDRDAIARPLADELIQRGLSVWFDEYELLLGDPLRRKIDDGLVESTIGVVILSPNFFAKPWPQSELDGLTARLMGGEKNVIVPVWHELTEQDLLRYSPLMAGLLAGRSADGVQRLADAVERVLTRRASPPRSADDGIASPGRRTRRRTPPAEATTRTRPVATTTVARSGNNGIASITVPVPVMTTNERAATLAERAIASLGESGGECFITLAAGSQLVARLAKRHDGVISVKSRFLSPQQRVLVPQAHALLCELMTSALSHLSNRQLDRVEVRSTMEVSSDAPPRPRNSEQQIKMTRSIVAALGQRHDSRAITLESEQGTMLLIKTLDAVEISVSLTPYGPAHVSSGNISDAGFSNQLLACLTEISSEEAFDVVRFEDRFPLPGKLSYSKLRVLTEELIAARGRFAVWQKRPVERAVLTMRTSRSGALVLERPGDVPSVQKFRVGEIVAFVEALQSTVARLVDSQSALLEVRASWLIAASVT